MQRAIFSLLLLLGTVSIDWAQSVDTKPLRGFMPNADYQTSPVDSVDLVSGNLNIPVPMASLPHGRAGFAFDLNLLYNSHVFDVGSEGSLVRGLTTGGGWTYNIKNYSLTSEYRPGVTADTLCGYPWNGLVRRLRIGLADGSSHVLHLKVFESTETDGDGFISVNPDGTRICGGAAIVGVLTYYTTDATYLKLEIPADGTNWQN